MKATLRNDSPVYSGDDKFSKEHNEHHNSDDAELPYFVGDYQPGSEAERKLLRKLDMRIIVRR